MNMYEILIIVVVVTMCLTGLMIVYTACKKELQPKQRDFFDILEELSKSNNGKHINSDDE